MCDMEAWIVNKEFQSRQETELSWKNGQNSHVQDTEGSLYL